ncbi:MAG: hypothetical protein FWF59_02540 [Turicibacter sp.]|nr:hypothetical protein [Turicibacter sp.]
MAVVLDSRDLALVDQEFSSVSQVWDVLREGAKSITVTDFVGVREVRVNKMTGFQSRKYNRNKNNERTNINVTKQTLVIEREDWMGYDLDILNQSENGAYDVQTVVETHIRQVSIPERDQHAVVRLYENSEMKVRENITPANALKSYDDAEKYMVDSKITGPFVMFVSTEFYRDLKNSEGVSKSFTTNTVQINGIDRRVGMIDGNIPILPVSRELLQNFEDEGVTINYILVPLTVAAPIEKYNDVEIIPASQDANGYRDKIKGLTYYDLIVFENARKAIYISYRKTATPAAAKANV